MYELDLKTSETCHLCNPKQSIGELQNIGDADNLLDKTRVEPFPIPISIEEVKERLLSG